MKKIDSLNISKFLLITTIVIMGLAYILPLITLNSESKFGGHLFFESWKFFYIYSIILFITNLIVFAVSIFKGITEKNSNRKVRWFTQCVIRLIVITFCFIYAFYSYMFLIGGYRG